MPDWLDSLVDEVGEHMTFHAASGPLGYRYREEQGFWEITIYPTPVELVGGAVDGEVVAPGFSLDLEGLQALFEEVKDFSWNVLGWPHEGPHVSIEGICGGHEVFLQILAQAPDDEEPGAKVDTLPRDQG
ncbi:MAG TPA: hypothetical protein PKY77_15100 [Phycisphaerae bacterium]|nr:hypothetical protein [Phycisphaerae bacterium]HRY70430.1 hypothetical protein [Phycisphaerae bacterium]HSA27664.1 hypothetical protein [Phycisphaerae bacterium]